MTSPNLPLGRARLPLVLTLAALYGLAMAGLVSSSIAPFAGVMRNVLRLMGKGAPVDKESAIKQFCAETGLDSTPFLDALHVRRAGHFHDKDDLAEFFDRYLSEVGKMAEVIDKYRI